MTRTTQGIEAGDVLHREAYLDCTLPSTDARLNGMASELRTIDRAGDGSTTDAGQLNVTAATGDWSGSCSGSGDW